MAKTSAKAPMTILVKKNGKIHANDRLTTEVCRWPMGDPRDPNFHLCGEAKAVGKTSYCPFHQRKSVDRRNTAAADIAPEKSITKAA